MIVFTVHRVALQQLLTVLNLLVEMISTNERHNFRVIVWDSTDVEVGREGNAVNRLIGVSHGHKRQRVNGQLHLCSLSRQLNDMPIAVTQRHRCVFERERELPPVYAQFPQQGTSFELQDEVGTRTAERE